MKPFLATPYNIDPNEWTDRTALHCKDPTLAQQHFKDECDVNILFGRYLETGEIPQVLDAGLAYGDFTGIFDFQSAMNAVRTAQETFATLPARIKNRFDNDPQKLLDFLHDPDNREEAQFLGLIDKENTDGQIPPRGIPGQTNNADPEHRRNDHPPSPRQGQRPAASDRNSNPPPETPDA